MSINLLIKSALLIDPAQGRESECDLRILDGDLVETGKDLPAHNSEPVFDAKGCWVMPGFTDAHTHLRDLGQSDKEDVETGTLAAAAGGFTTVLAMANTDPPIDSPAMLTLYMSKVASRAHVQVLPVANVTKGMAGAELTSMCDLASLGAAAFSDDGMPVTNLAVLRRALEYARLADRMIISHAEDRDLAGGGSIHEGPVSTTLGLPPIAAAAEAAAIAREIEVARQTGGRLHFAHVSLAQSVELIRSAREDGLAVTADVTPHHLMLCVDDIEPYNTSYKMNPPLRTRQDQDALVEGIKDGVIDAIATDHAPHTRLEKAQPFDLAPFGIIGLETAFSIALERLVLSHSMFQLMLAQLLTVKPARLIGMPEPSFETGNPADLVIIDPQHKWIYDAQRGHSKSVNSPFNGRMLTGAVSVTLCRGRLAYKNAELADKRTSATCLTK